MCIYALCVYMHVCTHTIDMCIYVHIYIHTKYILYIHTYKPRRIQRIFNSVNPGKKVEWKKRVKREFFHFTPPDFVLFTYV